MFTGIEIPEALAAELSSLRGGIPGARWVEPSDYHVTLRFIGDVDAAVAREIFYQLERVETSALKVRPDGLSFFGGKRPHSIIVAVKPDEEILKIQAEHERIMRRIGLAPETRKFTPHITLARLRRVGPELVADYLSSRGLAAMGAFVANHFTIFSSRSSVGGGPYVVEARFPLRDAPRS